MDRPCPSQEDLQAFATGQLDPASREAIEAHLADCTSCKLFERMPTPDNETLTSHARSPNERHPRRDRSHGASIQPGTLVGRYLVVDLIGTGGMGSVYRAYDPKLNRNVALKLIRVRPRTADDDPPQPRLLREAQALAQVVHPNVVAIFDVGEFREQVFFAMELIEGSTLRDVMRRAAHDPRTSLRLLDQAGRGLAAAHDAGLVHRDFKPENVLVDREQRAKVVDFGLARAVNAHKAADLVSVPRPGESPSMLDLRITETGAFLGTPAYMAPEQYLGQHADARSDQFSFACVAYEALFGQHPFLKGTKISMVALCAGEIVDTGRRLDPAYLRVLRRGLSRDPANRYPSLEHLLDDLARVPRRRRRRGITIAAIACAAGAILGVPAIQKHRAQRCDAAATQALAGIWDTPRREKIEAVFVGDGQAFGRALWKSVAAAVDTYAEQWRNTSVELCRSADGWRSEDSATHARSASCLDERRRELRAATDVLAEGDRDVRARAHEVLLRLGSVSSCLNPAVLAFTRLPAHDAATSNTVERIRDLLAQSRALNDAHKVAPGESAAREALELARKLPDRGLAAEALHHLSMVQETGAEYDASEASIVQALAEAEASGQERLLPLIWLQMIRVIGNSQGRTRDVEPLIPFVQATVERFDPQGPAHVELLFDLGIIETRAGRYEAAAGHLAAALEMSRRVFGENNVFRIEIYQNLAIAEQSLGQLDRASAHIKSALSETEALFGNDYPAIVETLALLAQLLGEQGDSAGMQAVGQRARAIIEQSSSLENKDLGYSLSTLGRAYLADAQPDVALSLYRRAYAMASPNEPNRHARLSGLARAEEMLGQLEVARSSFEEALAMGRRMAGPGHALTILYAVGLGRILRALHREREALQVCTAVLEAAERPPVARGISLAWALSCVGESYEQLGRLPAAVVALERAQKLLEVEAIPPRPLQRGIIGFALARVLWDSGGDRDRARRLATEAADTFRHGGRADAENAVAVETWLTKTSTPQR
ncbi:tetratricopeptide repeat protein [Pendulispora brunnea]|uniref:Tetratricopeptide repeat protein n=1 Tax=Pendulispora brunnea TaxID=2905690 RepID=A0ABZ2K614_9BACT